MAAAANKNPQTYPFRSQYKESDMEMLQEQARTQTCICLTIDLNSYGDLKHCPTLCPYYPPSYPPLNSKSIWGSLHMAISTLQLSLVIFVCFTYSHLTHSRTEALCVALQAFKWQVLNEEMNTGVITKSVNTPPCFQKCL